MIRSDAAAPRARSQRCAVRLQRACAAAAIAALSAAEASATIVWEGRVVEAWPDEPASAALENSGGPYAFAATAPIGLYPHPKGVVWGLTMLVDFSDQAPAFSPQQVDAWLNQEGYAVGGLNGSVRDYYRDNSNGVVDLRNEVVGFYRAKNPKAYYEGGSGYARAGELVAEMIAHFDGTVDFSRFDNDKDGKTEAISIVYAGEAQTWGQGLWPHAGSLRQQRDGVSVARYQMTAMSRSLGLYTFSHEIGHMLFGWPDLYGFGNYCIMGNGSSQQNPVGINDLYRADQGWIPVVDVDATTNATYEAAPNGAGYRFVNPARPREAFFWSNVQNTGRWSSLRGNGMLLLHFDMAIGRNNPPNPLSLAVVQADGKKDLDRTQWPMPGSDPADFFREQVNDEFSNTTTPATKWNDGSASGLRVYDIGPSSRAMRFSVGTGTQQPLGGSPGVGGQSAAGAAPIAGQAPGPGGRGGVAGSAAGTGPSGGGNASVQAGAGLGGVAAIAGAGSQGGAASQAGASSPGGAGGTLMQPVPGPLPSAGASTAGSAMAAAAGTGGHAIGAGGSAMAGRVDVNPSDMDGAIEAGCSCRHTRSGSKGVAAFGVTAFALMLLRRRRQ